MFRPLLVQTHNLEAISNGSIPNITMSIINSSAIVVRLQSTVQPFINVANKSSNLVLESFSGEESNFLIVCFVWKHWFGEQRRCQENTGRGLRRYKSERFPKWWRNRIFDIVKMWRSQGTVRKGELISSAPITSEAKLGQFKSYIRGSELPPLGRITTNPHCAKPPHKNSKCNNQQMNFYCSFLENC